MFTFLLYKLGRPTSCRSYYAQNAVCSFRSFGLNFDTSFGTTADTFKEGAPNFDVTVNELRPFEEPIELRQVMFSPISRVEKKKGRRQLL